MVFRYSTAQAGRALAILLAGSAVSACVVPKHMHVTDGVSPQGVDTNVRFRTTYYFRVFDYCWTAGADLATGAAYQKIVPESDTLYRYRMTGKASSLGSRIKFESGTLHREQIDPFGADVRYNRDIDGFIYRSRDDAKQEAKVAADAAAARAASTLALGQFQTLADMLKADQTKPPNLQMTAATRAKVEAAMQDALQRYVGTLTAPPDAKTLGAIDAANAAIAQLTTRVEALEKPPAAAPPTELAKLKEELSAEIEKLEGAVASLAGKAVLGNIDEFCSIGESRRRGFQIMGPEGMRPFDQDQRLILAMHTSAEPLIETLSEYSARILQPPVNASEQLLPLVREANRTMEARRALDLEAIGVAEGDKARTLAGIFDAAVKAFTPEAK
jgi:hypothetical protein